MIKPELIMTGPPKEALENLWNDLRTRLREQKVPDHSIQGIEIAIMMAFRLGERHGVLETLSKM